MNGRHTSSFAGAVIDGGPAGADPWDPNRLYLSSSEAMPGTRLAVDLLAGTLVVDGRPASLLGFAALDLWWTARLSTSVAGTGRTR